MEIIAHRGVDHKHTPKGVAPQYKENSWSSLYAAITRGFPVEFDVWPTEDGIPVISHDETLSGSFGRTFVITKTTLGDLQEAGAVAHAMGAAGAPLLEHVLEGMSGRERLYAEFKDEAGPAAVAALLQRMKASTAFLESCLSFSSFHLAALKQCAERMPNVERCWLLREFTPPDEIVRRQNEYGLSGVHIHDSLAKQKNVAWLRGRQLSVRVYTVNDFARARELDAMGVHGVFTDFVDLMRDLC